MDLRESKQSIFQARPEVESPRGKLKEAVCVTGFLLCVLAFAAMTFYATVGRSARYSVVSGVLLQDFATAEDTLEVGQCYKIAYDYRTNTYAVWGSHGSIPISESDLNSYFAPVRSGIYIEQ